MADIEFRPDQQVPAGRYYVILRPVQELPPAQVPAIENIVPPAEVPNDMDGEGEGVGAWPANAADYTGRGPNGRLLNPDIGMENNALQAPAVPPNQPNAAPPNIAPPNAGMNNDDFDDASENNLNNNANQQGGKKKKRNNNTKNVMKKAKKAKGTRKLSGYMKFAQEVRPRILKENPALRSDIPGMGRKIGEMWRSLSANEKARY
jgi:hypothetical protein